MGAADAASGFIAGAGGPSGRSTSAVGGGSAGREVFDAGNEEAGLRAAAAAFMAVRWKSSVDGVEAPPAICWKRAWELGLGAGNMEPPPPGVSPVRKEDSFGVGKLARSWPSK